MALPAVVHVERKWRVALLQREGTAMTTMTDSYLKLSQQMVTQFEALAEQVTRMQEMGEPVAIGKVYQLERYQRMATNMDREFASYRPYAEGIISDQQRYLLQAGIRAAEQQLGVAAGSIEGWPKGAVEKMVGQTQGGPLKDLLASAVDANATSQDVGQTLVNGVGLGKNPGVVAQEMTDTFGIPLDRSLCIARTEMLSAFRSATLEGYRQAGIMQYQRLSAQDDNVCVGCISAEGELFPTNEDFEDHPNAILAGSRFAPYGGILNMVAAKYAGPAVRLRTAAHVLTIGPNHPVLTQRGMVPASKVHEGDQLVYDLRLNGPDALIAHAAHLEDMPLAEDAFGTLCGDGTSARVASPRYDLHGDRDFCQGKVHVVRPDRQLLPILDSGGVEQYREGGLVLADAKLAQVAGLGAGELRGHAVDLPSAGGMGGGGALGFHFAFLSVVDVRVEQFEGWAFDGSTVTSLYCCDGFVVSNCRCSCIPYYEGAEEFPMGQEWFDQQDEATQEKMLGSTRYQMYKNGDVSFGQLASRSENATWGGSIHATTIGDLRQGLGGVAGLPPVGGAPLLPGGIPGTTTANAFAALPPGPKPIAEIAAPAPAAPQIGAATQHIIDNLATATDKGLIKSSHEIANLFLKNPDVPEVEKQALREAMDRQVLAQEKGRMTENLKLLPSEGHAQNFADAVFQTQAARDEFMQAWQEAKRFEDARVAEAGAARAQAVAEHQAKVAAGEAENLGDFEYTDIPVDMPAEKDVLPYNNDIAQRMGTDEYGSLPDFTPTGGTPAVEFKQEVQNAISELLNGNADWTEYVQRENLWSPLGKASLESYLNDPGLAARLDADTLQATRMEVRDLVHRWAETSADEYPAAVAMQLAAQEEFGLVDAIVEHFDAKTLKEATTLYERNGAGYRAFLRAMYDNTQVTLHEMIGERDYVTLYRGMVVDDAKLAAAGLPTTEAGWHAALIDAELQPMSSFSLQRATAGNFASTHASAAGSRPVILVTRVPVTRIIGTFRSGYGCADETEFVVLGGTAKMPACSYRVFDSQQSGWWRAGDGFAAFLKGLK